jgi:single-stranded-DNA-specific exonuclease
MTPRWLHKSPDPEQLLIWQEALGVSAFWATILAERGIENAEQAKQFFNPSWAQIPDPFGLKDMDKAVALLLQAMTDGQHILLFGDYDVDGTTATALMYDFIRLYCGYEKVHYYLPDRYGEGYGLSLDAVEHAQSLGAKLLVTLDCGITGIEPITAARALDIEVIVLDHHVPSDTLPPASAIVNPLQVDCSYPSKNLSGCGLAFKLAQAMAQRLAIAPQKVQELLDLVAVSTACDIVDVRGENRVLLHFGLQRLERQPRPGLLALIKASGKKAPFSVSDIVFGIGPLINAAGRMGHARTSVSLLLARDYKAINALMTEIKSLNRIRKETEREVFHEALEQLKQDPEFETRSSLVVSNMKWHKGVLGIVAARLSDALGRPTIVLSGQNYEYSGSARSIKGLDLYEALSHCSELLLRFGGHVHAAGLSIYQHDLPQFCEMFEATVAKLQGDYDFSPEIGIDAEISLKDITPGFLHSLTRLAPYGPGNMRPVFLSRNLQLSQRITLSRDHKHLFFSVQGSDGKSITCTGFGLGHLQDMMEHTQRIDLCYVLEQLPSGRLHFEVKDIRASEAE